VVKRFRKEEVISLLSLDLHLAVNLGKSSLPLPVSKPRDQKSLTYSPFQLIPLLIDIQVIQYSFNFAAHGPGARKSFFFLSLQPRDTDQRNV